jgi:tripartite-type tricarboxylate transporter receptor subunit TctC
MQCLSRTHFAAVMVAIIAFALTGADAWSQSGRTIKVILPFAPGGPAYNAIRILGQQISATGGPTIVVEPHPGAGTAIGTELVATAASDGNTVGIISNSFVLLPQTRKLNYDPLNDLVGICDLVDFPPLIVVNSETPYRTLADLIAAARAQPGNLTLASVGPATVSQLTFEMLKLRAKVDMTFVPYPGYSPAIEALLGSHVTAALADYSSLVEQIKAGKLRALATTMPARIDQLPDVPTVAESGYRDFVAEFFVGLIAPVKTPKDTVSQIGAMFTAAMQPPDIKAKLAALGLFPNGTCGADFATILRNDYEEYGRVIREANIKME